MPIRILPPHVASGIAAGEVVERPASVVKELIENALDAGASTITVEVTEGGMESIRVIDDGSGIPSDEVAEAFKRHATSKLNVLEDLEHIQTMGFRGEALPSIASVSKVQMITRPLGSDVATLLEVEGSQVLRIGPSAGPPGTTVTVEELFMNIPARRKYLRTATSETGRIKRIVQDLSLASSGIKFEFYSDGREILRTPGTGSVKDAMAGVFGTVIATSMVEIVDAPLGPYGVRGLIGPASITRGNRTGIHLFVNGRSTQHRALSIALEEAYHGFLMTNRFPVAVVFLTIPSAEVDFNVHPSKREVRLLREGDVFSSVSRSVRQTLMAGSTVFEMGKALSGVVKTDVEDSSGTYSPPRLHDGFARTETASYLGSARDLTDQDSLFSEDVAQANFKSTLGMLKVVGQVANTYVVTEASDGIYIVDQHAGHEKVMFDKLMLQWGKGSPEVQPLLDPIVYEMTPDQVDSMKESLTVLEEMGFFLEEFGGDSCLVRAVPSLVSSSSIPKLLDELLEVKRDRFWERFEVHYGIAASIACHGSIRAGQTLSHGEMVGLVEALAELENPGHCPHGRPTSIRMGIGTLGKQFKRI